MKKLKLNPRLIDASEVLTRQQLKNVLGGSVAMTTSGPPCNYMATCEYYEAGTGPVEGTCEQNSKGACVCNAGTSSVVSAACSI